MKYFFVLSFLFSFRSVKLSANRVVVEDLIKTFFFVFIFSFFYLALVRNVFFSIWIVREFFFLFFISFLWVFLKNKNVFEYFLIYFLFIVNVLHVLQSIIGYKIVYFYNFLDMLWLPGTERQTLVYSPGEFGSFFVLWFGLYFDRINVFIDEASTYAIINFALSVFLISVSRRKFAICFFAFSFFASMAKVFVILLPLFLFFNLLYLKFNRLIKLFVLFVFVFIIGYPFLINILVDLFFNGQIILDLSDSLSARIYWTWMISQGSSLWDLGEMSLTNFAAFDGYVSKLSFFMGGLFSLLFVRQKIFALSLLFTLIASFQYGSVFFMGWLYYILLVSLNNITHLNRGAKRCAV
ncbi:hypothetical protein [Vibrio cholerae]|uniref:hypothetical protein n=3 Tax=Vibrio cholerae TaxID=666 RepID=UPI0022717AC6|nr:hypothetical protein [Vibrio cholerae]MCX9570639.1 hypothetical protein [Vibrio cholerae]